MVEETSKSAQSHQCGRLIWAHSMSLHCIVMLGFNGKVLSSQEPFQEKYLIIEQLYSNTRLSFLVEFRITPSAKRHMNLTLRNKCGTSSSKLVTSQNQEMIIHFRRLMPIVSLFSEDLSQDHELMIPISALKMEEHWNGKCLLRVVLKNHYHELPKVQLFMVANCTYLEVWMRTIPNFAICGSLISHHKPGRRSCYQLAHPSQDPEADIAQIFTKTRCTSSVEF